MSDDTKNSGGILSGGIQDVAALLPLLGTDQCERHAGDALAKGYLYGAIIPVSLFGCLGAVKVALAVFLGTITYPFFGGRWLDDVGFRTPGSVSSMVTIAKGTGRYGAEIAVEKLLKEQNITDVSLVEKFEISDGRKMVYQEGRCSDDHPPSGAPKDRHWTDVVTQLPWNTMLIICSLLSAVVSIGPYLYLMDNAWNEPLSWLFPLLRSFGSFLCVVVIQLALQRRIHRLANLSLEWRRLQQKDQSVVDTKVSEQLVLEQRICKHLKLAPNSPLEILRHFIASFLRRPPKRLHDVELAAPESRLKELLAPDWILMLYQLALAVGMGMTVTGYVGCFSLVSQTSVEKGPYVWFGLETALSLLRIIVWGWNPKWDDGTGLSMSLQLREMGDSTDVEDEFIHVTSPYSHHELKLVPNVRSSICPPQSFIAYNEENFLGMVTPWVGPLRPLGSPDVTLFYSILFDSHYNGKTLYTTVYFTDSRPTLTFTVNELDSIFTSALETNPFTRAVQISTVNEVMKHVDSFIDSRLYQQIVDHCRRLSTRLFRRQQMERLAVKWNIVSAELDNSRDVNTVTSGELSKYDRAYIALQEAWTAKSKYSEERGDVLGQLMKDDEYSKKVIHCLPASFYGEVLFVVGSIILELQLWHKEMPLSSQQTLPECIRTMHLRISAEKKRAVERYSGYNSPTYTEELTREWDNIQTMLLQLRESKEKQEIARKIISRDWSVNSLHELQEHLRDLFQQSFCFLPYWISNLNYAVIADSTTVDVTPTPEQKLFAMSHLGFIRLKKIRSTGFSIARSLGYPHNSASWHPYVDIVPPSSTYVERFYLEYTSDVLLTLADSHHALKLDATLVSLFSTSRDGSVALDVEEVAGETQEGADGHEIPREEERSGFDADGETSISTQKILSLKTLTTLILSNDTFDDKTCERIDSCLKNSPNIICLAGTECHIPGQDCDQQHCKSILANRQAWKKEVHDKLAFKYRVGFEGRNREDVDASGDHIQLQDTGRCFALFHCPSPGELKITLDTSADAPFDLEAMLVSDVDGSGGREPVIYRNKKGEMERVILSFSNVPKGTGSISVEETSGEWWKYWKIHGLVTLEWAPSTNVEGNQHVKEDNRSPLSAENRREANEEENKAGTGNEAAVETSTAQWIWI